MGNKGMFFENMIESSHDTGISVALKVKRVIEKCLKYPLYFLVASVISAVIFLIAFFSEFDKKQIK